MSRPTIFPEFALNDYQDPVSLQNNVEEPTSEQKNTGWTLHQKPYRQHFNWLHRNTNLWLKWFDSLFDVGITASATIFDQALLSTSSPTFSGMTLKGDVLPDMTGGTGIVSLHSIGSATQYLKSLYTDEIFIGASSLYVNGKKVIEDVSNEINISTSNNQDLRFKTTGTGIIYIDSEDEINALSDGGYDLSVSSTNPAKHFTITNSSANGNIALSAAGVNGQVQLLASEIDLTATTIDINGAVDISGALSVGSLTVNGSSLSSLIGANTGTTSSLWGLDNDAGSYPQLKNDSGALRIRNKDDNDDADLIVKNLTVNGTTTTVNSETLSIADNIMLLNSNVTGTPTEDGGLEVERGTETNASLIWDEGSDIWKAGLVGSEIQLADINYAGVWDVNNTTIYYNGGNVGIGTNDPSYLLEVSASSPLIACKSTGTNTPTAFMYASTNGSADFGSLTDHPVRFFVNNLEKVRIDSSGNFMIGNTSTTYKLDVNGTSILRNTVIIKEEGLILNRTNGSGYINFQDGSSNNNWQITHENTGNILRIFSSSLNGILQIGKINTDKFLCVNTETGGIGIGTDNPSQKLELYSSINNIALKVTCTNADSVPNIQLANDVKTFLISVNGGNSDCFTIRDVTNATDRIVINTSGYIGIGATTPSTLLDISSSSSPMVTIQTTTDGVNYCGIDLKTPQGSFKFVNNKIDATNRRLDIQNSTTNLISLTENGNVGINTTAATEKLDVRNGNIFLNYDYSIKFGSDNNFIKRASSGTEQMILADAGSINIIIDSDNNASNTFFTIRTNGTTVADSTELFKVQDNGNTIITGSYISSGSIAYFLNDSSDGTDNKETVISGTSGASTSRGGHIRLYGNEHATYPGQIRIVPGSTGVIELAGIVKTSTWINANGGASKGLYFNASDIPYVYTTALVTSDNRCVLNLYDDSSFAQGVGSGIRFNFKYNAAGDYVSVAGINAYKTNATDGNYSSQLHFQTRPHGGNITTRMIIDENGNVGIGKILLESWISNYTALQLGGNSAIIGTTSEIATSRTFIINNAYYDASGWKRFSTDETSSIGLNDGKIRFFTDASGTADALFTPTERMIIDVNGNVGIATITPTAMLDISSGDIAVVLGANSGTTTRTNNTNKYGRIGLYHYTNSEEPITLIASYSDNTSNVIFIGGSVAAMNAATQIVFYTASNFTTTGGTARGYVGSSGGLVWGSPTGLDKGAGTINAQAVYDDNVLLTGYVLDKYVSQDLFDISVWDKQSKNGLNHIPARKFLERFELMFSIDKYSEFFLNNKFLPTFEDIETSKEIGSAGTMIQKLWETVEIQAIHIHQLNQQNKELKNRIKVIEEKI